MLLHTWFPAKFFAHVFFYMQMYLINFTILNFLRQLYNK